MGKGKDIIIDEEIVPSTYVNPRTIVRLDWVKANKALDKRLDTIARVLVEKLLPYFITTGYTCPQIILSEADDSEAIILNDFVSNQISAVIQEIPVLSSHFELVSGQVSETFAIRLFKIFFPKNVKSRISLVAHRRKVSSSLLHNYVPENINLYVEVLSWDKVLRDAKDRNGVFFHKLGI